jgi:hypothetical protein
MQFCNLFYHFYCVTAIKPLQPTFISTSNGVSGCPGSQQTRSIVKTWLKTFCYALISNAISPTILSHKLNLMKGAQVVIVTGEIKINQGLFKFSLLNTQAE